jgi:hypothetical protein
MLTALIAAVVLSAPPCRDDVARVRAKIAAVQERIAYRDLNQRLGVGLSDPAPNWAELCALPFTAPPASIQTVDVTPAKRLEE